MFRYFVMSVSKWAMFTDCCLAIIILKTGLGSWRRWSMELYCKLEGQ